MYIYIYLYICVCAYICLYIHNYICVCNVYTYMYVFCVCIYAYVCVYACMCMYIHVYMYLCICMCVNISILFYQPMSWPWQATHPCGSLHLVGLNSYWAITSMSHFPYRDLSLPAATQLSCLLQLGLPPLLLDWIRKGGRKRRRKRPITFWFMSLLPIN